MFMKRSIRNAVVFALGLGVGMAAYAQGRHDDKPHEPTKKSAAKKNAKAQQPSAGGRHDDKAHGAPKSKADSEKK